MSIAQRSLLVLAIAGVASCFPLDFLSDCTRNTDCDDDEVCVDGACVECADDNDCDSDEYCDDGDCEDIDCETDNDCDDDELCDDGRCRNISLGEGEGEGTEGEGGEGEASEGEGETGEGEGADCASRCECAAGLACVDGTCTTPPVSCATDDDCARGDDICAATSCFSAFGLCIDNGASEGEGEGEGSGPSEGEGEGETSSGVPCASRCECAVGEACISGTCQQPFFICVDDEGCGRGETTCDENTCVVLSGGLGVCSNATTPTEGEGEGEPAPVGIAPFHVQLTWDNANDLDVHIIKQASTNQFCIHGSSVQNNTINGGGNVGTTTCSALDRDASWFTAADNTHCPSWDNVAGCSETDAVLDVDSINGFGPENMSVQALAAGAYLVAAYRYSGNTTTTTAEMRVFFNSLLVQNFTLSPTSSARWDEAAIFFLDENGASCVEDLTDGNSSDDCNAL